MPQPKRISRLIRFLLIATLGCLLIGLVLSLLCRPTYTTRGFMAFSPDGRYLVAGTHYGDAQLWDLSQNPPEGSRFSIRDGGALDGETVTFISQRTVVAVRETENEQLPSEVVFWDLTTDEPLRTIGLPYLTGLSDFRISADGRRLVVNPDELDTHRLDVWDLEEGKLDWSLELESRPRWLAASADCHTVAFWTYEDVDFIQVWDLESQQLKECVGKNPLDRFVLSPDGRRLAVGGFAGLEVCSLETGQTQTYGYWALTPIEFSLDGRSLLTVGGREHTSIAVWDVSSAKPIAPPARGFYFVKLSPDGKLLAMYRDPAIRLRYTTTGRTVTLPNISKGLVPSPCVFVAGLLLWALCWIAVRLLAGPRAETAEDVVIAELVDENEGR